MEHVYFTDDRTAPYCDMVTEGSLMFLSGLVSEDLTTREELYGDITFETRRVMENLKVLLEAHGSDMDHVLRIDVLLKDFSDKGAMNEEYVKHFAPGKLPARLCYGGVDLSGECRIEIAVIAARA
ncbi:MAG: RidA family protein [Firmicutes bacterium]|nr:RidA family protein [Bacillota bacterium]MBQ1887430.1 RidA family protein [Bacillota bacterium]MBQ2455751.1 RidA family protein [Bacillota bacterium]MBQ3577374.1 RidA family protein [Bacillota bacterium]MBQ4181009.1 RidA family protein [Bacillota bacterium]